MKTSFHYKTARVRIWVDMWGFVVDKAALGHVFSEYFSSTIPPNSPSSSSPAAGTIGLLVAAVLSGPKWTTPPSPSILIKKKLMKIVNSRHAEHDLVFVHLHSSVS
jgi:hypothetical protein